MKANHPTRRSLAAFITLGLALLGSMFGQGITTSALSGYVSDKQGKALAGATIVAVHEPSGTRATAVTRPSGQFNLSGLRDGGPYTITTSGPGGLSDTKKDIFLELGQTLELTIALGADVVRMEAFKVEADRDTTFGATRMGTGTAFSEADLENIASIRGDVQDIAKLDSRLTLNSLDRGGQLSAQGQNNRFNSFLIDGVEANDPYGLNDSGMSSLRSPIPLEALSNLTVELNPYDIRRAGFTGALLNAGTKSGTNRYTGSAQYEFTNERMRAKHPVTRSREAFKERRYTLSLSGPILKDRLFFAYTYDDFQRDADAPAAGFILTAASLALLDQAVARAKALGYDPGTLNGDGGNRAVQKTHLGKLDWNISSQHRASFTFRQNEGVLPTFTGRTSNTGTSLSNQWFDQPRDTRSYTTQVFSRWTADLTTEASYSYTTYEATGRNRGAPFSAIGIGGLTGVRQDTGATATGFLNFGTGFNGQLNSLNTKESLYKFSAEYALGDHTFVAGGELTRIEYDNRFLQGIYGSYTFNNSAAFGTTPARTGLENWLLGLPTSYTLSRPQPGNTVEQAFAQWTYTGYAFYVQDTWRPNARLTVTGGLRYDLPTTSKAPPLNTAFTNAFGVRNDGTNDGNSTFSPRVGFNYRVPADRKTELRGGVGLFVGRNPAVWLANAYQNAGTIGTVTVNVNGNNQPALQFQPDVTRQPLPAGNPPVPNISLTDPNFRTPALWKGNIAIDHKLPFGGLTVSAEFTASQVDKGLMVEFLNFQTPTTGPATLPDGRIRYAGNITPGYSTNANPNNVTTFPQTNTTGRRRVAGFGDVHRITNANNGRSSDFTFGVSRPMRENWSANVAWTRGSATEVSPLTSSTAGSLITTRAIYNPNERTASTSNTQTRDKIVARYAREFEFIKKFKTTVSLVYEGRTGRAYSWVFSGDANGDGYPFNDLLYVPTGPTDPKVRWINTAERDAFFAFAAASGLNKYAGTVAPRNSQASPWQQTVDLTIRQQIPIAGRARAEIYLELVNLANLLDKDWGIVEEVPFAYRRQVAGAIFDPAANGGQGQYAYVFNSNTLDGVPVVAGDNTTSRWQAKIGVRVRF
ncbi:MAG: TonB-dependent receptor [Opitutaceae bacterium]|nr:TonB-dependent receptor [Opitutaceae bacterium]